MIIGSYGLKEGEYKKECVVSTEQKETIFDMSCDSLKQNFTYCENESKTTRHEECFKIIADYTFEKLGQEFDKKVETWWPLGRNCWAAPEMFFFSEREILYRISFRRHCFRYSVQSLKF